MKEIGQFSLCKIFASCDDVIEQLLSIFMQLYPCGIQLIFMLWLNAVIFWMLYLISCWMSLNRAHTVHLPRLNCTLKFLDVLLYLDAHVKCFWILQWLIPILPTKFCWNSSSSFCIFLLNKNKTKTQTNSQRWQHSFLGKNNVSNASVLFFLLYLQAHWSVSKEAF